MSKTSFIYRSTLLFGITGVLLTLTGCSSGTQPSTASEVQAFQGDPAVKARMAASRQAELTSKAQAGQAAARAAAAAPPAPAK